jgi:hypothetical protein
VATMSAGPQIQFSTGVVNAMPAPVNKITAIA